MLHQQTQGDKVKDWLCKKSGEDKAQQLVDATDNATTTADAARPLVAAGAAAAGISRSGFSQATSYLGGELSSGLSKLGNFGKVTGGIGIGLKLANGDVQGAVYSGADYFVYSRLTADSGPSRPVIPAHAGPAFRSKPATHSG